MQQSVGLRKITLLTKNIRYIFGRWPQKICPRKICPRKFLTSRGRRKITNFYFQNERNVFQMVCLRWPRWLRKFQTSLLFIFFIYRYSKNIAYIQYTNTYTKKISQKKFIFFSRTLFLLGYLRYLGKVIQEQDKIKKERFLL